MMVKKIWIDLLAALAPVLLAGPPASAQQTPPPQQQDRPNILFIMGDDIGWMQPSIYHQGLMVGETPTSTASGERVPSSQTIMQSRAAPPGVLPSSPA